ncbi:MAG TPA: hypothetical protein PK113_03265 [Bacillota bacterium]|nr:hypothetical protein [Bacillota bacterium]
MGKDKFGYGWIIKWVLAAILIAAGILMILNDDTVVYATTGIAVVIFSALRVVPLMKTLKKEVLRTVNLIEIIFDFIIGGLMIFIAFSGKSSDTFWRNMYGYMMTFFLLARGIIYFVSLYYFGEKTEATKFWTHLIFVGLGPVVLTLTLMGEDIVSKLVWALFVFALGGAAYLGYDGYGGYRKYRETSKKLNTEKQPVKEAPVEKGTPQPVVDEVKEEENYVS